MIRAVLISLLEDISTELEAYLRLLVVCKLESHHSKKEVSEWGKKTIQRKDLLKSFLGISIFCHMARGYADVEQQYCFDQTVWCFPFQHLELTHSPVQIIGNMNEERGVVPHISQFFVLKR
jgi:hypothetical protein